MERQQQIYNYLIHPGGDIAELVGHLEYEIQRLSNLLILSYGDGVTLAIRVAEQLERCRIARKICVDLGLYRVDSQFDLPKIMILMSTVLTPEFPLDMSPSYVIHTDSSLINWLQPACAALEQGKLLCLVARGSSIPNLISEFLTLQDFFVATKISISTCSNEQNQEAMMAIKVQGSVPPNRLCISGPQRVAIDRQIEVERRQIEMERRRERERLQQGSGPLPRCTGPIENAAMNTQREEHQQMQNWVPLSQFTAPTASTHAVARPAQAVQLQEPRRTSGAARGARAKRQRQVSRKLRGRNNAS